MAIGWLDCAAGASGDMFLGALADLGVPLAVLQDAVDALGTEGVELVAEPVIRHGLAAVKVDVRAEDGRAHRRFCDIRELIDSSGLAEPIRRDAADAFARLGRAEAAAHRVDLEDVHFHEVGALDSLADVVATCAGLHWLRTERGLTELSAGTVTAGVGVTTGAHGGIPLPAPATLAVLAEAGAPVAGEVPYEACTPTGAALVAAHATAFGPMPAMRVTGIGVGAGGRDPAQRANVLRLVLGEPVADGTAAPGTGVMIEANIDDLDPRVWPAATAALFDAGASDAWLTPIVMKKGRPAHTLHVLCRPQVAESVRAAVVRHTSTIGMRGYVIDKFALDRESGIVTVDGHDIGVKLARHGGEVVNVSVEYEDVAGAARALGRPVKTMLARATAAAAHRYG